MTDLSTTNLKRLLDEATPRPWIFREDTADTVYGTQEIGHEVYAGQKYIFSAWNDPVIDEHPETLPLAALAPELAAEVLRLRKALDELYSAVVRTAEDCAIRDDHEGKLAARVAQSVSEQLFRILLEEDHDD